MPVEYVRCSFSHDGVFVPLGLPIAPALSQGAPLWCPWCAYEAGLRIGYEQAEREIKARVAAELRAVAEEWEGEARGDQK